MNKHNDNLVNRDQVRDYNLNGRRVRGASPSVLPDDYTVQAELAAARQELAAAIAKLSALDFVLGGSHLPTTNVIPKVGTAGQLVSSSITDDGTTVSLIEVLKILLASASVNIRTPDNTTSPVLGLFQDQGGVQNYGAYAYIKATSSDFALVVRKNGVDTEIFTFLNTNGRVGVKNVAPAYPLDVTGDINTTTLYRVGGTGGFSGTAVLAKITAGGTNGSLTIVGGIVTAYLAPT